MIYYKLILEKLKLFLGKLKLFCPRFFRRLRHTFQFKEMYNHEFESCQRCGSTYHMFYDLKDFVWYSIFGSENGCYCLDCLIKIAKSKNIEIEMEDFNYIEILFHTE
jgi:hypothetical protein